MLSVQVGIRGNHFRLEPDTEFHSHLIYFFYQICKPALNFFLIYLPITKGSVVVTAIAKPAVVHDKHFNAKSRSFSGNVQQFLRVKIKIGSLPVVDENRAFFIPIFSPNQMSAVKVMERSCHLPQTFPGIYQNCLRRHKFFAGLKFPSKILRADTDYCTANIKLIYFCLHKEISGIYQMKTVDFSHFLIRSRRHKGHEWLILMACLSAS